LYQSSAYASSQYVILGASDIPKLYGLECLMLSFLVRRSRGAAAPGRDDVVCEMREAYFIHYIIAKANAASTSKG